MKIHPLLPLLIVSLCALPLRGAVIQFENFAQAGDVEDFTPNMPYTESGFSFTPFNDRSAIIDSGSPFKMPGNSTDFLAFAGGNTITLTATAGTPFNLASLDIGITTVTSAQSVNFTIVGTSSAGSTTFTFNNISTLTTETLNLVNLSRATITTNVDGGIDNVNATAVPEPGTASLGLAAMGIGLGLRAWIKRRRTV